MKKILCTLSVVFFANFLMAQEATLLQNYKFRIAKFRVISFTPNSSLSKSTNKQTLGNTKSSGFTFYGLGNYSTTKSTNAILQTTSVGFGSNVNSTSNKNSLNEISSQADAFFNPVVNYNAKWYNDALFYVEAGLEASSNYGRSKFELTNAGQLYTGNKKLQQYWIKPVFGIGKGRLENVTDMQNALWLYRVLQKEGNLKRSLSYDEVFLLAQSLTTVNNKRILDGRRRIKAILKAVDGYLNSKDVVQKNDINYFTNLNDIIFYANNFYRVSGSSFYLNASPSQRFQNNPFVQKNITKIEEREKVNNQSVQVKLGYNKYKPISLKHQLNYGIEANYVRGKESYSFTRYDNAILQTNTNQTTKWREIGVQSFVEYSYYPNTRTLCGAKIGAETGRYSAAGSSENFYSALLEAKMSYFINFNTRVNAECGYKNQNSTNRFLQFNPIAAKGNNVYFNFGVDFTF